MAFPPTAPETTIAEVISESGGAAAARRRDREVRPRHLLLQRRTRGGVGGGGAAPRRLPPRRRHLRPQAGDERRRGRRRLLRGLVGGGRALRDHQLRQPGHGRAHRRHPRRGPRRSRPSTPACGEVVATVLESGGACIVTADHGNAEHMLEPDGSPNTAHTTNPVPLIVTVDGIELRDGGILADVSPTVLDLLGIEQPRGDDRAQPASRGRGSRPRHTLPRCAPTPLASASRSSPATGTRGPACCTPRTGRSRRPPSCRWRPAVRSRACSPARSPRSATGWCSATPTT